MPCRDYYDSHPDQYFRDITEPALKARVAFAESALCAALAALAHVDGLVETVSPKQGEFYNWINFAEAGIAKEALVKWHKKHQALDQRLREAERIEKLKAAALAKLTLEEQAALGIKK